jgi:hypothetical protein
MMDVPVAMIRDKALSGADAIDQMAAAERPAGATAARGACSRSPSVSPTTRSMM